MKKVICSAIVAIFVIGAMSSCKKALEVVKKVFPPQEFDLPTVLTDPIPAITFPIPRNTDFDLPPVEQRINVDSIIRVNTGNNFGAGDISSIKLKQITLKIVEGYDAQNNFSNFNHARFSFSSTTNNNKINIANATFSAADAASDTKVIPTPDAPELRSYLSSTNADKLYYTVTASVSRYTTQPMRFSIVARLAMK